MADIKRAYKALVARVLEGGMAPAAQRRAAFDNGELPVPAIQALIRKVAERAHQITDGDIAAAGSAGFSEDQIFELVVCAAIGQADRQYRTAVAALEAAAAMEDGHAPRRSR
jgi:hypothetical protein